MVGLLTSLSETQRQHEALCGEARPVRSGEAQNTTKSDAGGEAREGGFLSLSWQYTAKVCKALVNVNVTLFI